MPVVILGVFRLIVDPLALHAREIIWYEDNMVALSALTRGASKAPELDIAAMAIHFALGLLRTRIWFEVVESAANWLDEASRLLEDSPWIKEAGFVLREGSVPTWPWEAKMEGLVARVKSVVVSGGGV